MKPLKDPKRNALPIELMFLAIALVLLSVGLCSPCCWPLLAVAPCGLFYTRFQRTNKLNNTRGHGKLEMCPARGFRI